MSHESKCEESATELGRDGTSGVFEEILLGAVVRDDLRDAFDGHASDCGGLLMSLLMSLLSFLNPNPAV